MDDKELRRHQFFELFYALPMDKQIQVRYYLANPDAYVITPINKQNHAVSIAIAEELARLVNKGKNEN